MSTFRLANPTIILLSAATMALIAAFAPVPFSLSGTALAQELPTDDPPVNFRVTSYGHDWVSVAWEVPRDRGITYFILQSSSDWRVEGPTNGGAGHGWTHITVEPDTQYSFVLTLQDDSKTTIIEASVSGRTPPAPTPALSNDATLRTLTLSGINIGTFNSAITSYSAQVANNVTETTVTATVSHSGASYVIKRGGVVDTDGVISLAVGSNSITIEVTAEDGATTRIYTVSVTRGNTPSSPNFRVHSSTHDLVYVAWEIPHGRDITSYVLQRYEPDGSASPYARWEGSTHGGAAHGQGDGTVQPDTQYRYVLMLKNNPGAIIIETSVSVRTPRAPSSDPTPPDPSPPPSTDATLSTLTFSGIDIGTFDSATTSYTAQVANNVTETTVTATVNHSGASYVIKLNGVEDADGVIPLAVGSNVIAIEVTAQDGSTSQTYTVSVTRSEPPQPPPPPTRSNDATLSTLTLSGINFGTFDSATTSYSAQVANAVAQTTATPTPNHSGASYVIKLNGVVDTDGVIPLAVGSNVIAIEVTAQDSVTTRTYTVSVTRSEPRQPPPPPNLSNEATLSTLTLSGIDIGTFDSATTSYTARVANAVAQTTATPTPNHPGASYVIKLNGVEDADGVIPLAVGSNVIAIEVTAQDGATTRTYTVSVTRSELPQPPPPPNLSNDAMLSALTLSGINFGTFDSATTSYSAQVANNATETTVTATVNHSGASYNVKLNGMEDGDGVIPLAVGSNVIAIEVTAQDGSTSQTYTVIVTRDALPTSVPDEETPTPVTGELPTDDPPVNFRVTSYSHNSVSVAWEVPRNRGITNFILQRYEPDGDALLSGRWESPTNGGAGHGWSKGTLEPDAQYRYVLMLKDDSGTTIIEASVSARTLPAPTDTSATPEPRASTDATLSSLSLSSIDLRLGDRLRPFNPEWTHYNASVAEDVTETTVTATVNNPKASYKVKLGGVVDADGVIPLALGSSVITIAVTAEDGVTTRIYIVRVTRSELPQTPPQTPHRLTKVSGDDQEGMASAQLAEPFVVSVLEQDSSPLAGMGVTFSVTAGGGLLSSTTATTDANGRAATWLTLGSDLGTNTVEATVEGLEPVTFTAIGQESPFASLFDLFLSGKLVALPDSPQLAQNAPNPFNSQTVIPYFLLQPGLVRLEVFALTGQRVAVLIQGQQQSGYHRLHWDGQDDAGRPLASGIYLYRLVTSEDVLTRKLTLLR